MRVSLAAVLLSGALLAQATSAQVSETKVTLQDLPAAVQQAVKETSKRATLRGLSKEVKDGVTLYEVEMTVNGRTRDVTIDGDGRIVMVEEQTTLSDIPPAARAAIEKAVGDGKLVLVEKVTKGETTFYEGHVTKGSKAFEVKVGADGKPVE